MRQINDLFSREEIQQLVRPSDLRGAWEVLFTWLSTAAILALPALEPAVWSAALAVILLGGRQLALAILMHDAAHRSLFASRALNDVAAQWLVANPIWQSVARYRAHHLGHHAHTWTEKDPDLALAVPFPVRKRALARKFARDLLGLTGVKQLLGRLLMDAGVLAYTASPQEKLRRFKPSAGRIALNLLRHTGGFVLFHVVFTVTLWALGVVWVYGLWWLAYLTTYPAYLRLRAIAEHAGVGDPTAELGQTRSTRAGILARLTVAPHNVYLHLEHHLLMTAPCYRLPRIHRRLRERRLLNDGNYAPGYLAVLRRVSAPTLPRLTPTPAR